MGHIQLNAIVSAKIQLSPHLMILQVKPEGWSLPDFKPGQYGILGLPASAPRVSYADLEEKKVDPQIWLRRAYSVASSSVQKEQLEFYIALVQSGSLTPRLFQLKKGDRLHMGPKIVGMFTFDQVPADQDIVLIATGTGVAPYLSMVRTFLTDQPNRRFALIHGARHSWDLGYGPDLNQLATAYPYFTYLPVLSQGSLEAVPWSGLSGYVQDVWAHSHIEKAWGRKPTPDNAHVFLCGNPDMVEDMAKRLVTQGFAEHKPGSPGHIHCERYW